MCACDVMLVCCAFRAADAFALACTRVGAEGGAAGRLRRRLSETEAASTTFAIQSDADDGPAFVVPLLGGATQMDIATTSWTASPCVRACVCAVLCCAGLAVVRCGLFVCVRCSRYM